MAVVTNYVMHKGNKYASHINLGDVESLILVNNVFKADKIPSDLVYSYYNLFGYDVYKVDNELVNEIPSVTNLAKIISDEPVVGDDTQAQKFGEFSISSRDIFGKEMVVDVILDSTISSGNIGFCFEEYPNANIYGQAAILQGENKYRFLVDLSDIDDEDSLKDLKFYFQLSFFTGKISAKEVSAYSNDGNGYVLSSGITYITNYSNNESNVDLTSTTYFDSATIYNSIDALNGVTMTAYDSFKVNQTLTKLSEKEINDLKPGGGGGPIDPDDPAYKPTEPGFNGVGEIDN